MPVNVKVPLFSLILPFQKGGTQKGLTINTLYTPFWEQLKVVYRNPFLKLLDNLLLPNIMWSWRRFLCHKPHYIFYREKINKLRNKAKLWWIVSVLLCCCHVTGYWCWSQRYKLRTVLHILGSSRYCFGNTHICGQNKIWRLIKAVTLNMVLTLLLVLCFR